VQFPAGLSDLVRTSLEADLGRLDVLHADDSALMVGTPATPGAVAELRYLRNAYQVLADVVRTAGEPGPMLDRAATAVTDLLRRQAKLADPVPRGAPFRVMATVDGQLAAFGRGQRAALERELVRRTGGRVQTRGSGEELWLIGRRDLDRVLLAVRLPQAHRRVAVRGSLSPELAELLVRASRPEAGDSFLDPMGGSGSIVAARLARPARRIGYNDLALDRLRGTLPDELRRRPVVLTDDDASRLSSVASGSVDAIVTDPPWGEHEPLPEPAEDFVGALARSLARVLHPDRGRLVLLISRRLEPVFASALATAGLPPVQIVPILVNGHPACVVLAGTGHVERTG
jgi:RMKL-like, methyltransferase domain